MNSHCLLMYFVYLLAFLSGATCVRSNFRRLDILSVRCVNCSPDLIAFLMKSRVCSPNFIALAEIIFLPWPAEQHHKCGIAQQEETINWRKRKCVLCMNS